MKKIVLTIFNKKKDKSIQISNEDWVIFMPKDYLNPPFIEIIFNGFDFYKHSIKCNDCGEFIRDFGTGTLDWCVNYMDKTERLDLLIFGKNYVENNLTLKLSEYESGTKLKLYLNTNISTDKIQLQNKLEELVENEDYLKANKIHKLIKEE